MAGPRVLPSSWFTLSYLQNIPGDLAPQTTQQYWHTLTSQRLSPHTSCLRWESNRDSPSVPQVSMGPGLDSRPCKSVTRKSTPLVTMWHCHHQSQPNPYAHPRASCILPLLWPSPFPPLHPCAAGSRSPKGPQPHLESLCSSPALWPLLCGHRCHHQPGWCGLPLPPGPPTQASGSAPIITVTKCRPCLLFIQQVFAELSVHARHCSGHWRCSRKQADSPFLGELTFG